MGFPSFLTAATHHEVHLSKRASDHSHAAPSDKLSTNLVWLYTMISITLMTLLAAVGIFLAPLISSPTSFWSRVFMSFLISLGVGTLLGDAFLHLLLRSLGFHSHDDLNEGVGGGGGEESHSSHDHDFSSMKDTAFVSMLILLSGILFFFLADHVCRLFCPCPHVHHHPPTPPDVNSQVSYPHDISPSSDEVPILPQEASTYKSGQETHQHHQQHHHHHHHNTPRHVVGMILLGDALHNFMDGLAIGMTFAQGSTTGWSTTLTVFCHELPHELGDIAVLLSSGMSKWRVALYNMASNLTSFVGGMLGILVYQAFSESVNRRILAFTAGGFVYIALANLMPLLMSTLHQTKEGSSISTKHKYIYFFFQCMGLMIGIGLMVLMVKFEEYTN
ncbi:hypothetical protein HMI55_000712 [Coelomomyces lativittatus]|nr:hypothetical protein HMI56_006603 [Coelomomyces lativittatus]KAJ1517069.1 hypothetical protein HMI55_000712 [Coelomomyces lativittatus]